LHQRESAAWLVPSSVSCSRKRWPKIRPVSKHTCRPSRQCEAGKSQGEVKRKPRREKLPEHLRRIEHHYEPKNMTCACGEAMVRIGEDVSERLDVGRPSSSCTGRYV